MSTTAEIFTVINEIAPLIAISGIALQIYLQNRGNLKLQKDYIRQQLKLELFEKFQKVLSNYSNYNSLYSYTICIQSALLFLYNQPPLLNGQSIEPISYRYSQFLKLKSEHKDAIFNIIFLAEDWEIVDSKFKVFRLALSSAYHNFESAANNLHSHLMHSLPIDVKNQNNEKIILWPNIPSHEYIINTLNPLIENFLFYFGELSGYIHDIKIEFQNILLGNLFGNHIEYRKPLDPKCIAIDFTKKSISEWIKYFEDETAWGKKNKLSQDFVKRRVENER